MKKIYVKKIEKCHTIGPIKPNAIAGQTKKRRRRRIEIENIFILKPTNLSAEQRTKYQTYFHLIYSNDHQLNHWPTLLNTFQILGGWKLEYIPLKWKLY